MSTLVVLRHAKSAWPPGIPDQERPLNNRGRRDAPAAGRWLANELPHPPELAVVSPAQRTRQTWRLAAPAWEDEIAVRFEPQIYAATAAELLAVVRHLPTEVSTVVLVGHNPGCEDLVTALAGPGSDPAALAALSIKYPTAGTALLRFQVPWPQVVPQTGVLLDFAVPRG